MDWWQTLIVALVTIAVTKVTDEAVAWFKDKREFRNFRRQKAFAEVDELRNDARSTNSPRRSPALLSACVENRRLSGSFTAHDKGPEREGQQQVLRVYFAGIYDNINQLLSTQIKRLNHRYEKTKDAVLKQELDRLKTELEQLPEQWDFRPR